MLARRALYSLPITATTSLNYAQVRGRRRTMVKPPGVPEKYIKARAVLKEEDRDFIERELRSEIKSTCDDVPWDRSVKRQKKVPYDFEHSKRIGLVGKKIGMAPQWLKDGRRVLCTLIHCVDNHVLHVEEPENWYKKSLTGKTKAFGEYGPMWNVMVGAFNSESVFHTKENLLMFKKANVPPKERVVGFVCSEDAIVWPGTKLDVRHFTVGQYISISAKTIDYGFQGVMHRWGMRGQSQKIKGKSHRRVGGIGATGEARVWPGKRLPGHMGYEWRHNSTLEVLRINPITQVIYVLGSCPGDVGEYLVLKDTMKRENRVKVCSMPTFFVSYTEQDRESELARLGSNRLITARDIYSPKLARFDEPSIVFTEKHETKAAVVEKVAKTAKVKDAAKK